MGEETVGFSQLRAANGLSTLIIQAKGERERVTNVANIAQKTNTVTNNKTKTIYY